MRVIAFFCFLSILLLVLLAYVVFVCVCVYMRVVLRSFWPVHFPVAYILCISRFLLVVHILSGVLVWLLRSFLGLDRSTPLSIFPSGPSAYSSPCLFMFVIGQVYCMLFLCVKLVTAFLVCAA